MKSNATALGAVTCVLALALSACTDQPPAANTQWTPRAEDPATATALSQADQVSGDLADLASDPGSLIATSSGVTAEQARQAFPIGTQVIPDSKSWAPDGSGSGGTMRLTVATPGQAVVEYLAVVVRETGGWKVLGTIQVEDTP